jgi:hypothetical protein
LCAICFRTTSSSGPILVITMLEDRLLPEPQYTIRPSQRVIWVSPDSFLGSFVYFNGINRAMFQVPTELGERCD